MEAPKIHYTSIVRAILEHPQRSSFDAMIDKGTSPRVVADFMRKRGVKASYAALEEYVGLRRVCFQEGVSMSLLLGPIPKRVPIFLFKHGRPPKGLPLSVTSYAIENGDGTYTMRTLPSSEVTEENIKKAKNDMEVLEFIIQKGYSSLQTHFADKPIPIATTLAAIQLKHKLLESSAAGAGTTAYGLEYLKKMEQGKFVAVLQALIEYIPPNQRAEVVEAIDHAEEAYYKNTEYYDEYRKAKEAARSVVDSEKE
jgi:hypothetical protein